MLLLALTTDKIDLVTDAAATLDVHVSYVDASNTTLVPSGAGKQNTAIATAATTDILSAPGAATVRNVKTINIRNKHASQATACTVRFNANGTAYELFSVTLLAGMVLEFIEGVGWFTVANARLDRWLRVSSDYVNATTSFTDVTGLTCNVESGKTYNFETHLIHAENATTTGPRFGINGPTLSAIQISILDIVTIGVDTTTLRSGSAAAHRRTGSPATPPPSPERYWAPRPSHAHCPG